MADSADLIVKNGTVVTSDATFPADLAIKDHGGKPEAAQAIWAIAESLRNAGLLAEAASYDEKLVEKYPKDPHARDAAFNAVALQANTPARPTARPGARSRGASPRPDW